MNLGQTVRYQAGTNSEECISMIKTLESKTESRPPGGEKERKETTAKKNIYVYVYHYEAKVHSQETFPSAIIPDPFEQLPEAVYNSCQKERQDLII